MGIICPLDENRVNVFVKIWYIVIFFFVLFEYLVEKDVVF